MSNPPTHDPVPPTLAQDGQGERGNFFRLCWLDGQPWLLKTYRRRRSRLREFLAKGSHRLFEGKRGIDPRQRRETELQALRLWKAEGFVVPAVRLEPAPPASRWPSLWLEYLPGPRLFETLHDPQVAPERKRSLVADLARAHGRRHRRALELDEPLLVQEHPTTKHVLVVGARLVTVDLEEGYAPGYPLLFALARELAGVLRSLEPGPSHELSGVYVEAYADRDLLRDACRAYFGKRPVRWLHRTSDRLKRGPRSKTAAMEGLVALLGGDL